MATLNVLAPLIATRTPSRRRLAVSASLDRQRRGAATSPPSPGKQYLMTLPGICAPLGFFDPLGLSSSPVFSVSEAKRFREAGACIPRIRARGGWVESIALSGTAARGSAPRLTLYDRSSTLLRHRGHARPRRHARDRRLACAGQPPSAALIWLLHRGFDSLPLLRLTPPPGALPPALRRQHWRPRAAPLPARAGALAQLLARHPALDRHL